MSDPMKPDALDYDVWNATLVVRRMWRRACHILGLTPTEPPDVILCERSVPEDE